MGYENEFVGYVISVFWGGLFVSNSPYASSKIPKKGYHIVWNEGVLVFVYMTFRKGKKATT